MVWCMFGAFCRGVSGTVCRLDGCSRPCFVEAGRVHEFCGQSHAQAFDEQAPSTLNGRVTRGPGHGTQAGPARPARPAPAGRFDKNGDYRTPDMVLFWQPPSMFSQWTPSVFFVDDVRYSCAEQYMMAEKARLFGDLDALAMILATDIPSAHKKLGRGVRGYDRDTWNWQKKAIVMRGSLAKFDQNPIMAQHLLDTGEKGAACLSEASEKSTRGPFPTIAKQILAEASPHDTIWGIGLRADDPDAWTKDTWRGQNLLGEVLQEVRSLLLRKAAGLPSL